jgi:hypothetical protein
MTENKTVEHPLTERYLNLVNEIMDQQLLTMTQNINKNITAAVNAKQDEITKTLTLAFGATGKASICMADLPKLGRKLALEKAEGKHTIATKEKAGPEGNTTETKNPISEIFNNFGGGNQ